MIADVRSVERLSGPCAGDRDERAERENATNPRGSAAGFRKRRARPTRGRVDAAATGGEGNLPIAEPPRRKAQRAPALEPRPPETGRVYPPHTHLRARTPTPDGGPIVFYPVFYPFLPAAIFCIIASDVLIHRKGRPRSDCHCRDVVSLCRRADARRVLAQRHGRPVVTFAPDARRRAAVRRATAVRPDLSRRCRTAGPPLFLHSGAADLPPADEQGRKPRSLLCRAAGVRRAGRRRPETPRARTRSRHGTPRLRVAVQCVHRQLAGTHLLHRSDDGARAQLEPERARRMAGNRPCPPGRIPAGAQRRLLPGGGWMSHGRLDCARKLLFRRGHVD